MKKTGIKILTGFQKHWQILIWLEVLLYAFGTGILVWLLSSSLVYFMVSFVLVFLFVLLFKRPWTINLNMVSQYLDEQSSKLEYSSGLVLEPSHQLSGLAQLQRQKVAEILNIEIKNLMPRHHLQTAIIFFVSFVLIGMFSIYSGLSSFLNYDDKHIPKENQITLIPKDSVLNNADKPTLKTQQVTINYPAYTGLSTTRTSKMNINAVKGSKVTWELRFEGEVDSVSIQTAGKQRPLRLINDIYSGTTVLKNSGFYNFTFTDTINNNYVSELYAIEVKSDDAPVISIKNLKQFSSFKYNDEKKIQWDTYITDDFGVDEAFIVATVTKGKGESVKFREEHLNFDESISNRKISLQLSKTIDLEAMNMQPGDELYFYVEARDEKQPSPNISRSETYFAKIKDTLDYGIGVEAGLGVDLMPDYFRSQRQLIIDTEQLISERSTLSANKFNATSNDLGFDQKALRLKYAQFMGGETEYGMRAISDTELETNGHDRDNDPLSEYTHDHDGKNENNFIKKDNHVHDDEEDSQEEDPLAEYLHNHSDPESSTLFTDNLKQKLRQALNIMWDAELHLRLNEPEKSLPYQYDALELIQDIKNSARIYVHRIGFDPPPIKQDKRLSGDRDEVVNFSKQEEFENPDAYASIRKSIKRIEELKRSSINITTNDRQLFEKAGQELAQVAIDAPGMYLNTLRLLKRFTDEQVIKKEWLIKAQGGLLKALPNKSSQPGKANHFKGKLNDLVLKELR